MHTIRKLALPGLAAASLAMILAVPVSVAQGHGHGHGHGDHPQHGQGDGHRAGMMLEHLADRLELDDAQRTELEQILTGHHEDAGGTVEQLRAAERTLETQVSAETFDEAAIRGAAAEVAALRADLAVSRAAMLQQLRLLLTAEQLEEFAEMHEHMGSRERGPGRHGFGHGPGR